MEKELTIAKIVSNATPTSWSQAYNAGKLFAVISLTTDIPMEENTLNLLGKEILDNLEAEYFAMETKDLEAIKLAVKSSLDKVLENINCSFVVGALTNNVLYTFAKNGKVEIKRIDKLGIVLDSQNELETASGFLEDSDIIILETSQFSQIISQDSLLLAIDSQPVDQIAENIAPMIHERADGGAAAIIVEYKKDLATPSEEVLPTEKIQSEEITNESLNENIESKKESFEENYIPNESPKMQRKPISLIMFNKYLYFAKDKIQNIKFSRSFDRSRRTVFTVAIILLFVFIISVFFAIKNQGDSKNKDLFAKYYVPAEKKYEEGQGLLDLNQALARDTFAQGQKILLEGEPKFSKGSSQKKQADELLKKLNDALSNTANIKSVTPKEVTTSESKILASEIKDSTIQFATKDGTDIYTLDSTGVLKNSKLIIKKDWGQAGGLGVFYGNVYVLDKSTKQILKFVSTANEYVKTNYFAKNTTPDVSTANSLAIDGSIWTLLNNGTVLKFTRGAADNLSLTGLDKEFSSPTRIFTNADLENIYILDNGNSRIVVFNKNGAYKVQYQSSLIKGAKNIEVTKSQILILSGNKIYSFDQ